MSSQGIDQHFDSIESAQEFLDILATTILDVMKEVNSAHAEALEEGAIRRARAFDLAKFKLKTLGCSVHKGRRALNDLRMLRRLITNERLTVENVVATM